MKKKIKHILLGREKQITREEVVRQPLPHMDFRFANPFIVLHHLGPKQIEPGQALRIHPHPHRGFAPVTFMLQGEGYHKDSAGHDETVKAGDAQWMFAGKGILHSEGPTQELLTRGGVQELLQLWVNVPAANKFDEPSYQSATKEQQPFVLEQGGVSLRLVSGHFDGKTGPLQSITPVISIVGEIAKGKTVQMAATPGYWTLLYIVKGSLSVNLETVDQFNLVVFEQDNEEIILTAEEDTQILFLSAEPINEPIAAKDNFVMNTAEEIEQAMADYKVGVFGSLAF
ncbi:pirin family protein [Mucilaginibacter psychrotolerans]|uniref:Pirin family protein n=1 Tax=Mucilaginibacter psychrotolerans TaxID=1524096 RepID=A0A4Y8SJR3_9SPHI|nr:pirin family protein [Mucilaginibacter psychrotolerans]TFF39158.1 pirin family protein [Mucilaginibacter psychrotolerans]